MSNPFEGCTEVTLECPVSGTTYGYIPDLPSNAILLTIFFVCTIAQFGLAIRFRTWAFGFAATVGCLMEGLGYVGRVLMHENVWNRQAFIMQVVTLILAPSFLAAAIYLTLKHMVLYFGSQYSRLKPVLYVWIFVSADVASILLQAAGGGLAASSDNLDTVNMGNDIMVAGLIMQVVFMALCLLLAFDFAFSLYQHREELQQRRVQSETSPKAFRFYLACTCLAFVTIFVRTIYRVPELIGGWGNDLMRKELEFMLLDGMMIAIAAICMTIAHPGIFFQAMTSKRSARKGSKGQSIEIQMRHRSESSAEAP